MANEAIITSLNDDEIDFLSFDGNFGKSRLLPSEKPHHLRDANWIPPHTLSQPQSSSSKIYYINKTAQ